MEVDEPEVIGDEDQEKEDHESDRDSAKKPFLSGYSTLEDYSKVLLGEIVKTTKRSGGLPCTEDEYEYYSSFPGFRMFSSRVGARVNKTIGKLLHFEQVPIRWPSVDRDATASAEDVEEQFDLLVEANDHLLEQVSMFLDEASGKPKTDAPLPPDTPSQEADVASWNKKKEIQSSPVLHRKANVPRPQLQFRDMVDNSNTPFVPLIRHKPNAIKPLPQVLAQMHDPVSLQALIENAKEWASSPERTGHPYQYELDHFQPMDNQLVLKEPIEAASVDDTPLVWVETCEQLQEMLKELQAVTEFAVDLEAHSYRSYQGFVCLMQVSTRARDFIVDTLVLREHMHILNEVFTDPRVVKVFHGADWDVVWLQRDFGIYIVNLFDTGQASRVLGLPRYSLAFLLNYCCGVKADKQYQLADWRIRPLPAIMEKYAREDTHFLLYIYDRLRNELIRRGNKQNNLLRNVLTRSRDICLKRYEKPQFHEDDYLKLYTKNKQLMNPAQLLCLKLLFTWRDIVAREEDESRAYVLPNHMLLQIAEALPREMSGILACCNPAPTLLRQKMTEVFRLVTRARESSDAALDFLSPSLGPSSLPSPSSSPSAGRVYDDLPPAVGMEATDGPCPSPSPPRTCEIAVSGPPVAFAQPLVTVFAQAETTTRTSVPKQVQQKMSDLNLAFKQLLAVYQEAVPISPEELIRRSTGTPVATPTFSASPTPAADEISSASGPSPVPGVSVSLALPDDRTPKLPFKRKLSVREMGKRGGPASTGASRHDSGQPRPREVYEDQRARKRPRTGSLHRSPDFKPFDFGSTEFSRAARGTGRRHSEPFRPRHSEESRDRRPFHRSKVHQKGAERSHTFTTGRGRGRGRHQWPRS